MYYENFFFFLNYVACSESGSALPSQPNMLLVTALALPLLWLISLCLFAAQVRILAILTKFLLLAGGPGLAELLTLSPGAEQEVGMLLRRLQTLCSALCVSLACTTPLH